MLLFIRAGPAEILSGAELSHELVGILVWATTSIFGESEITLRLRSVISFLAGVLVVTAWLHRRLGAAAGMTFLFLATCSPLVLDTSRQARGYGLAFLAMAVMLLGAIEAHRTGGAGPLAATLVRRAPVPARGVHGRSANDRHRLAGCRNRHVHSEHRWARSVPRPTVPTCRGG